MKKSLLLFTLFPLMLAMQCDPEEEPCGDFVEITNPALITIENPQQQFNLSDTLWLAATVDRNLQTSDRTFDLFDFDESLSYYIEITKNSQFNSNNYVYLTDEALVVTAGESSQNLFILTKSGNNYQNRTGIKLLESGNYTLRIYNIGSNNPYRSDCDHTSFSIVTAFAGLDSNAFTFTVD